MTKSRWLGVALGLAMIVAAFGVVIWQSLPLLTTANVALAQAAATSTPVAQPTVAPQPTTAAPQLNTSPKNSETDIGAAFWQALATKLGVSVDTLKSAALQVRQDMIDQAVKDGKITQAQADQIKGQLNADKFIEPIALPRGNGQQKPGTMGPGRMGKPGFGFFEDSPAVLEAVAKVLNLQPSDLTTQLSGGKTLADIATAQKVDQAVVKQAILDARKAEIDRELADGLISQAQADSMQSNLTPDKIDLTSKWFFFGHH